VKRYLLLTTVSLLLILLSVWLVSYGLDQRRVHYGEFTYGEVDIERLPRSPGVLYGMGLQAWQELDADRAAKLFRQVVVRDPLYMDAWLKLAEAEIEAGNEDLARKIGAFCHTKISRVLRWKQSHTLLAHDLAMQDIFRHNLNYLVDRKKWLPENFYLLDTHTKFETDRALVLLSTGNWPAYLEWLISWERTEAAQTVWDAIEVSSAITGELLETYVHYLVSQKDVAHAAGLWLQYTGIAGMSNAGFEKKITQKGFDWRIANGGDTKSWQYRQVYGQSQKGSYALRVSFLGKENMAWHHIYQVVPVTSEQPYRLTFWWKSKGITTDQGPFVEIYSYDSKGLYVRGPMTLGSRIWTQVAIDFSPPADCHAVVVRLRRNESLRFDSKIQGVLWVDEFALTLQKPKQEIGVRSRISAAR
jgi:hypothetical protein